MKPVMQLAVTEFFNHTLYLYNFREIILYIYRSRAKNAKSPPNSLRNLINKIF